MSKNRAVSFNEDSYVLLSLKT